jgi:hypothetical protein
MSKNPVNIPATINFRHQDTRWFGYPLTQLLAVHLVQDAPSSGEEDLIECYFTCDVVRLQGKNLNRLYKEILAPTTEELTSAKGPPYEVRRVEIRQYREEAYRKPAKKGK